MVDKGLPEPDFFQQHALATVEHWGMGVCREHSQEYRERLTDCIAVLSSQPVPCIGKLHILTHFSHVLSMFIDFHSLKLF